MPSHAAATPGSRRRVLQLAAMHPSAAAAAATAAAASCQIHLPLFCMPDLQEVAEYWDQVLQSVDKPTALKLLPHIDVHQVRQHGGQWPLPRRFGWEVQASSLLRQHRTSLDVVSVGTEATSHSPSTRLLSGVGPEAAFRCGPGSCQLSIRWRRPLQLSRRPPPPFQLPQREAAAVRLLRLGEESAPQGGAAGAGEWLLLCLL